MTIRTDYRQNIGWGQKNVSLWLTTDAHRADLRHFDAYATLVIRTGEASIQTYLDADECRKLAAALMIAAGDLDPQPSIKSVIDRLEALQAPVDGVPA